MQHTIDSYAYSSRTRSIDPLQKAGAALSVLVLCLVLDHPAVGLLGAVSIWLLATRWASLPSAVFGRLLLAEGLFLALAVLGVAVNIGSAQSDAIWSTGIGPFWVSSSSIYSAMRLFARALAGASAMNFLALTTPMVDMIDAMRRLKLPCLLIDLLTLVYRFIFALLESLSRMYTAQDSRLGYVSFRRGLASAGVLASQLFVDAYQRTSRLQNALDSRCSYGQLEVLPLQFRKDSTLLFSTIGIAGSLVLVWMVT